MNENHSPDSTDMVTSVKHAFEAMHLPPAPARKETIDALARVSGGPGKNARMQPASGLAGLTWGQRFAVGGISLSAIAALVLLALALSGNQRLSAMERMARQLSEVKSYSYDVWTETITTGEGDPKHTTTWRATGAGYWQAPDSFRDGDKIVKIDAGETDRTPSEELLVEFVQAFRPSGQGIFIDYKKKTYFHCTFQPVGSKMYPLEPLKLIREDSPTRTRELGERAIGGKMARGYLVPLSTGDPRRRHDWQVWVDPETDLPLEIGYQVDDRKQPRTTTVHRLSNFRWNIQLDPKLFEPVPPEGFREMSPPAE